MARRRVSSREVFEHESKRFGSLRILEDGRVRFARARSHPLLEFVPNRFKLVAVEGRAEYGVYDSSNYAIEVVTNGDVLVFSFVVRRGKVVEGTFPVTPDLRALRKSVALMTEAGFQPWMRGALENTLRSMSISPFGTPARVRVVRQLIDGLEPPSTGWMLPPRPGMAWRQTPPGQPGG